MERTTISLIFGALATLMGFYSLIIIIRIMLTWFAHVRDSKPVQVLSALTDPYLNWWKKRLNLHAGVLDLSPIVAMAALSVAQTLCSRFAVYGKISLGVVLMVCLSAFRSVVSFFAVFCLIVLVLRFIAYKASLNIYLPFWHVIDSISRFIMFRINRIIFGKRLVNYTTAIVTAIIVLAVLWAGVQFGVWALGRLLLNLPI